MPCVVCEMLGLVQTSGTDAHHIKRDPNTGQSLGASQRASHWWVIPLCSHTHHWNSVYVSIGSRKFEATYGNELVLLQRTYATLGIQYPYEALT